MDPISAFLADPLVAIGNLIATSYLIPLALFAIYYAMFSPWWQNELGIALLLQKAAFLMIFVLIVLGTFVHDWGGRPYLRIVVYLLVGFTLWLDFVNLRRVQKRHPFKAIGAEKPRFVDIMRKYIHPGN